MKCKLCECDLAESKFSSYTYLGEKRKNGVCINCMYYSKKFGGEVTAEISHIQHNNLAIAYVHKWDFGECAERWQIPMSMGDFFKKHPHGKIQLRDADYLGDVFVKGVYDD